MIDNEFALLSSIFTIILAHSRIDNRQQSNSIVSTISSSKYYSIVLLQQLTLMIFVLLQQLLTFMIFEGGVKNFPPSKKELVWNILLVRNIFFTSQKRCQVFILYHIVTTPM
jgi:hypothetical protein